ncbi:hypothetical protein HMI54_009868 [Coelomomyces lativittatus]|nr:hypothetical protein HMI54_009868 [Coelomomyces lativittatus]
MSLYGFLIRRSVTWEGSSGLSGLLSLCMSMTLVYLLLHILWKFFNFNFFYMNIYLLLTSNFHFHFKFGYFLFFLIFFFRFSSLSVKFPSTFIFQSCFTPKLL